MHFNLFGIWLVPIPWPSFKWPWTIWSIIIFNLIWFTNPSVLDALRYVALTSLPTCNFHQNQYQYTTTELCANSSFDQLRPNEAVFSFHWLQCKVNFFLALMLKASGAFRCAITIKFYVNQINSKVINKMLCLQIQPSIVESEAWWNKCIVVYSWSRWTYFKTVHSQYNKVTLNTTVCLPVLSEILSKTHTVEFILFSSSFVEYHFLTDFIVVMINKIKFQKQNVLKV